MYPQITIVPAPDPFESESCIEQKYVFDTANKDLLLEWLEFHLVRDPSFYFGPVVSLYYDTPSLSFYGQVCDGDFIKTKIRLRWYQTRFPPEQQSVTCYLEIKRKYGVRRHKQRQPLALETCSLSGDLFSHPAILEAPNGMPEARATGRGLLVPVVIVQYERFRFVDPRSGSRISLDTGVLCPAANAAYIVDAAPVVLETDVLEVKGVLDGLPDCLLPISRHLRKRSFSKYATCCASLIEPSRSRRLL
jgi:VTC domain